MPGKGFASNPEHARECGRRGGLSCKYKYGVEGYVWKGRKGGNETKRRAWPTYYAEIGSIGGKAKAARKEREPDAGTL